ncbi:MAG: hypothetical protein JW969_10445 [Spirochaetales bacterium]|nr:hypothetical protein [Spirochaetales bacterium]
MKESLFIPIFYVLWFFLILIFLTLLDLFLTLGLNFPINSNDIFQYVTSQVPHSAISVFVLATILSLFLCFLRILKKPGLKILSILLPFITSYLVFTFGFLTLNTYTREENKQIRAGLSSQIAPRRFNSRGEKAFYYNSISDNTMVNNILCDRQDKAQKIRYYPRAQVSFGSNAIAVLLTGEKNTNISFPRNANHSFILKSDYLSSFLSESFGYITNKLRALSGGNFNEYLLFCFAIIIFISSCGVFMRFTHWPLFNFLFALLVIFSFLFLLGFYEKEAMKELTKLTDDMVLLKNLPIIAMIIFGAIFFIIDFVFTPREFWQKDLESE